jgi:hypothetical protein
MESPDGDRYPNAADARGCKQHADMGFADGWGAALDQLVQLMT